MTVASLILVFSIHVTGLMAMTKPACTWSAAKQNVGVEGQDIAVVLYANQQSCQLACEENQGCLSVTFSPKTKNCYLNKVRFGDDLLTDMKNYVYLEKDCPPCQPPKPRKSCTWSKGIQGKAIADNNVVTLDDTTLESCQQICNQLYYCKSIDWKPLIGKCSLNAEDDTDGILKTFKDFEWYKKECVESDVCSADNH
ncbi:hypothetical protein CAPTEDRAFT_219213, partial [Capitella teleta]